MIQPSVVGFLILLAALSQQVVEHSLTNHSVQQQPIRTVLILGNSIVRHPPAPSIGWPNDWGMAASVADSDFVHCLIRDIHRSKETVTVQYLNVANWERSYNHYAMNRLDSLRNPDLLIMRLAENVVDEQAADSGFVANYDKLITYLDPDNRAVKVITDGFWVKKHVNPLIQAYAKQKQYPFVHLSDLSADSTNMAQRQYTNKGVGIHPSDKGMRLIASRIWAVIKPYFT
ncbi:SGNH/GDSL hydrolase family protein [Spirosoma flavum]|uniref:SGNH/GDSL hydrolase family protein n=1 Tax=Spirosoma flavum TaxID=2048557 RepID=A0ABW6AJ03_9BACT